ncbi:rhomboid-like protein [Streptomyces sp. NPDC049040]|uniref:rhomboid-like protein n=1 Tax=Streptomyces sp. NPDC049040 TaxID=3365593 RepID=UPI003721D068
MAQQTTQAARTLSTRVRVAAHRLRRVTPRDAWRFAALWARSSPGTHIWLVILAATSAVMALAPPDVRSHLLHHFSTNLIELHRHPIRVLIGSAFWIQTPSGFAFYTVLFEVVHAPAERWLGTWRWLFTAATAHIGATLVSQKAVFFGIRDDRLPHSLAHTVDIGVSYGLAGVVGVLAYRVPRPWRWFYLAAVLGFFAYPLLDDGTYTDLGHLTAVLIGLGCHAVTPLVPVTGNRNQDGDRNGKRDGNGKRDRDGEEQRTEGEVRTGRRAG